MKRITLNVPTTRKDIKQKLSNAANIVRGVATLSAYTVATTAFRAADKLADDNTQFELTIKNTGDDKGVRCWHG